MAAGANIVALVDMDTERARKAAEEYAVPHYYGSLSESLTKHQVNFVSICTFASTHLPLAKTALAAGCAVLLEKPVANSLEEAQELRRAAEESGRPVCVVHNHKFYPGIQEAVQLHRAGRIGEVVHVDRQMTFLHSRIRMMEPDHWAHGLPGGRLFEANPHNLYLAYQFAGRMQLESLHAWKASARWPHAKIDEFTASLRGERATVQITMTMNLEEGAHYLRHGANFLVVTGTKGTLLVGYHRCQFLDVALTMHLHHLLRDTGRAAKASAGARLRRLLPQRPQTPFHDGAATGHKHVIERFVGHLEGRYPEPPTTWAEVLETQRLNEEMGTEAEKQGRC